MTSCTFHTEGLCVGAAAFLIIGLFHPLVIKGEYYFTEKIWPVFALAGIAFLTASIVTTGALSSILSVTAFTCFWSIKELKEQTKRVERGWFPKNPRRQSPKHHGPSC